MYRNMRTDYLDIKGSLTRAPLLSNHAYYIRMNTINHCQAKKWKSYLKGVRHFSFPFQACMQQRAQVLPFCFLPWIILVARDAASSGSGANVCRRRSSLDRYGGARSSWLLLLVLLLFSKGIAAAARPATEKVAPFSLLLLCTHACLFRPSLPGSFH